MDVKKCLEFPPSASKTALYHFLMVAAVAQIYLSTIATLISSTAILQSSMDAGLTFQTHSPRETVAEVAIRGLQGKPRDLRQSQNYSLSFEQAQDSFRAVSSCAILLTDIDMTGNYAEKNAHVWYVLSIITSKRIELVSPGWSGFDTTLNCFKTCANETF